MRACKLEAGGVSKNDCPEGAEALPKPGQSSSGRRARARSQVERFRGQPCQASKAGSHPSAAIRICVCVASDLFAHSQRCHRQVAMCLRAEEVSTHADKTVLKMMRDGVLRHTPREGSLRQITLAKGNVLRQHHRPPTSSMGPGRNWAPSPEFTLSSVRPTARSTTRQQEIVGLHLRTPNPPNNKRCSRYYGRQAPRSRARSALRHGMAVPTRDSPSERSPTPL